jgi:hypothetical protein
MKTTYKHKFCGHTAEDYQIGKGFCPACRAKKQDQSARLDAKLGAENHIENDLNQ